MADKRITEVDFINSLNSNDSFFVNQNNTIKQINKANVDFGFGSVATEDIVPVSKGGTGTNNGADGLKNLFAAGATVLSHNQYGDTLPSAGIKGRIFYKKVEE